MRRRCDAVYVTWLRFRPCRRSGRITIPIRSPIASRRRWSPCSARTSSISRCPEHSTSHASKSRTPGEGLRRSLPAQFRPSCAGYRWDDPSKLPSSPIHQETVKCAWLPPRSALAAMRCWLRARTGRIFRPKRKGFSSTSAQMTRQLHCSDGRRRRMSGASSPWSSVRPTSSALPPWTAARNT